MNAIGRPAVAFIGKDNSFFLKKAEDYAKQAADGEVDVYSAVIPPASMSGAMPKIRQRPFKEIPGSIDVVVAISCSRECPIILCRRREDWNLGEPEEQPETILRLTNELIEDKVNTLIAKVKTGSI